jgi:HPt (histidine-containing phosphotransfer) domain-containing protein
MSDVLDIEFFDHMTGADRGLQRELIELFRGQVEAWASALSADAAWRDPVHTLKGSARGIGLQKLSAACEAAETAGGGAALEDVRAALAEALAALERFAGDMP